MKLYYTIGMKKIIWLCLLWMVFLAWTFSHTFANNSFQLIPESKSAASEAKADQLSQKLLSWWSEQDFRDEYNKWANELKWDLGAQIRSWIFSRDSVLNVGVYILRFIMQIALVIGAAMIIKSGYTYVLAAMWASDKPEDVSKPIKNALIWLFVISISYTIIKLLQMAFLS